MALCQMSLRLLRMTPKYAARVQTRPLSLHEHESQKLLSQLGVPVPRGQLARSVTEVREAIDKLGPKCVIKAQVLGRGREDGEFESGLRGGVQAVEKAKQGESMASEMLGSLFRRRYSSPQGIRVNELYITESVESEWNWYLAMMIDRENYSPAIVISKKGGRDIDAIARLSPESIFTFNFGLSKGITSDLVSEISARLGTSPRETKNLEHVLQQIFDIFSKRDATMLEINPLACSADGTLTSIGSRFVFDNAAAKRQADLFALRDASQDVAEELEAEKHGLVYVKMDGNIANVVNGAGLAMATNDAIGFQGGASANFLDAGGKATKETMQQAFGIITRDKRVRAILVNIYGGLTRCDMIAESIIGAADELDIRVPMVVRLQGTNSEKGLQLLEEAKLGLYVESDFGRAAQRVVELAESA
ncbi:ATP-grasp domain-containing protein [Hirsutella rhossiliensis]|uniref:ATP-grasp domain-containing protein n=1 Tax=Hirsutella rhossiliensis TaxID=111463 RepID=A0A9P8N6B7_9HYPO|nr:ATP-grasp domain-containing protein [Hirsutella rhossiliensis]KAH0967372.1 ATP-grasp domain-containing protein [Hirsutella rhossiliensis]